ncbi:MAG: tRNA (adenosine(37)-N6)-threonylcarbamoyltransferase complex dimerization subunit type 1 TsaB [Gammaproteobacteria bacterium]|nr:MAG: tRNA (adenosine(37)-N6)-threonylcarbamoyltransferase complex dimerization subunit type 1 TsaB [Gammaproteobacteria bacterium]
MTKILALDASTDACSVAIHIDGHERHIFELAAKSHTQRLLPMVDEILSAENCKLQDLDAIAFGRGPGSFTGLRICMGIVQGLAFGANLPVIPISTLQAMARGFIAENPQTSLPVMVALDARMEEIYWGLFSPEKIPQVLSEEYVMKPLDVVVHPIVANLSKKFIAVGPGWHYLDLHDCAPEQQIQYVHPNAKDILTLALEEYQRGNSISILDAQPVYLRDSVSWKKRERIRSNSIV